MGISHSNFQNDDLFNLFQKDNWIQLNNLGRFQLWSNKLNGQLCQAYKLDHVPSQQELEHYHFRHYNQNAYHFVQIRYVDIEKNQTLCSHGQSYVLTEFIPVKLTDMQGLTLNQGYSLLRAAYQAFHTMQSFHGPFIPNQELIGINLNGKPKIWLNRNHSQNKADKQIKAQIWQKHMGQVSENVKRVLQMIQQKMNPQKFPNDFRQYFYDNVINFIQASVYVQQYCQRNHITIPHTIQYRKYIKDPYAMRIVKQYNQKRGTQLRQHLNTFQSYQSIKSHNQVQKILNHNYLQTKLVQTVDVLKRDNSHQHFTYHNNNQFVRVPQVIYVRNHLPINNYQTYKREYLSPVIQRTNNLHLVQKPNIHYYNKPYNVVNVQTPIISTTVPQTIKINTAPPTINNPIGINNQNKFITQRPVPLNMGMRQSVPVESKVVTSTRVNKQNIPIKQINYKNIVTPAHAASKNMVISPNKIASFEMPVRNVAITIVNSNIKQQKVNNIVQQNKALDKSFHQKINDIEQDHEDCLQQNKNKLLKEQIEHHEQKQHHEAGQLDKYINNQQEIQYLNGSSQLKNHQQQQEWQRTQQHNQNNIWGKYLQNNSNLHCQQQINHKTGSYLEVSHNQQLYNGQQHEIDKSVTYHIQHIGNQINYIDNNQIHQNNNQNYQNNQNYHNDDISPIKQNQFKNTSLFQNQYSLFNQYAKMNQNHQQQNYNHHQLNNNPYQSNNSQQLNHYEQTYHHQQQINHNLNDIQNDFLNKITNNHLYKPKNINLNQSANLSNQEQPYCNNSRNVQKNNLSKNQQSHSSHQPHQLQSSQRIRHLSSKNTSINRGPAGQSSGTLIVHDSRQNIYQGVTNQQKVDKIIVNIRQQSHQSQTQQPFCQDNFNNQQHHFHQEYQEQYHHQPGHQQYFYNNHRQQNNWENNQNYHQDHYVESDNNQPHHQEEEMNHHYQQIKQNHQQTHSQPVHQYDNLHFRNQSEELYQYTPVQSVYQNTLIHNSNESHNILYTFARPQTSSGVQQITKLSKNSDIQQYIKDKYSHLIGNLPSQSVSGQTHNRKRSNDYNRAMTFAKPSYQTKQQCIQTNQYDEPQNFSKKKCEVQRIQSLYEPADHFDNKNVIQKHSQTNQSNVDNNDFLDVGNLQKSLDQRYKNLSQQQQTTNTHISSPKNSHNVKRSQTMSQEDGINVAALQQKLQKFQQRQSIEKQKSQRHIEVQNNESHATHHNELNFNELDNIVELMDKKIQQSQKKQKQSSRQLRDESKVSEFNQKSQRNDLLQNVQLETSINNLKNKEISLRDIPILGKQQSSNGSNSIPTSKRQYNRHYGMDSEDFATGRGASSFQYTSLLNKKQSYTSNKKTSKYDKKYDTLAPVIELDKKYENYSSKNLSSYDYEIPSINVTSVYDKNQISRKSSRRSTKNIEQAKRLADQFSSKYDKYLNNTSSNYEIDKPFAKKKYSQDTNTYNSYKTQNYQYSNQSQSNFNHSPKLTKFAQSKYISGSSQVSVKSMARKRSSYLNPIQQLQGQHYTSPYKEQQTKQNQQNNYQLSNRHSKNGSNYDIKPSNSKRNSKVSYDELRDLLWK